MTKTSEWLDDFIADAGRALEQNPGLTYDEYMRSRDDPELSRTHVVDAGGWLDSFIGDVGLAMRTRPSITYIEYMRSRLERDPSDLDGVDHERDRPQFAAPALFEHDGGVIVLSEVVSVTCRIRIPPAEHGLTDCHVVLRSGAELTINAKYSKGLTQAMMAHHAGPPVMSVFLLSDDDRARARAGEVVPVSPVKQLHSLARIELETAALAFAVHVDNGARDYLATCGLKYAAAMGSLDAAERVDLAELRRFREVVVALRGELHTGRTSEGELIGSASKLVVDRIDSALAMCRTTTDSPTKEG